MAPDNLRPLAITGLESKKSEDMELQEIGKTADNAKEQKKRIKYQYEPTDFGPFQVLVENKSTEFKGKLNPITINDIVYVCHRELDNKIKQIESTGRYRVRIHCKDSKTANSLVLSKLLEEKNLDVYIPKTTVVKQGVVGNIELELTDETLKTRFKKFDEHSNFTIINVKRINKKTFNEETNEKTFVPTKSGILTFKSQLLPKYIALGHVRCPVSP